MEGPDNLATNPSSGETPPTAPPPPAPLLVYTGEVGGNCTIGLQIGGSCLHRPSGHGAKVLDASRQSPRRFAIQCSTTNLHSTSEFAPFIERTWNRAEKKASIRCFYGSAVPPTDEYCDIGVPSASRICFLRAASSSTAAIAVATTAITAAVAIAAASAVHPSIVGVVAD